MRDIAARLVKALEIPVLKCVC